MKTYLIWAVLFLAAELLITLGWLLLAKKQLKPAFRITICVAKLLVAVGCAALVMAGPVFLRPVQPFLVALYAALWADGVADLVYSIFCLASKKERKAKMQKVLGIALGVLFFVYGTVNMQLVSPHYHTYTSAKLQGEHKFVFVADLHVGSAQNFSTTEKTIAAIGAEKPDFVILGGDITDDYTTKEEMEQTYKCFGELGVPVYFIFGNHEVVQHAKYIKGGLPYTEKELTDAIEQNGIQILKDEYVEIAPDLLLLGREDAAAGDARADKNDIPNPAPEKFLLTADHQPLEKDNLWLGTDLQVSGHTHAGQLFPLGTLFGVVAHNYGDYHFDDATLLVSSGASGWRVPFRTQAHSQFDVITLKPQ